MSDEYRPHGHACEIANRGDAMPAMNHIAEVARLKMLETKAEPGPYRLEDSDILVGDRNWIGPAVAGDEDYQILVDMRNAAPWLLDVAGQFQAGDSAMIPIMMGFLRGCGVDEESPM